MLLGNCNIAARENTVVPDILQETDLATMIKLTNSVVMYFVLQVLSIN